MLPRPCPVLRQIKEAKRLLRPGGVLAFADNNPQSLVTHNLPPWLYAILRSTEPWRCAVLCHAVLCHAVLCHAVLCHAAAPGAWRTGSRGQGAWRRGA